MARFVNSDLTFNRSAIMWAAHYQAHTASGFHRTTYRKGDYAPKLAYCLTEIWKAARCERESLCREIAHNMRVRFVVKVETISPAAQGPIDALKQELEFSPLRGWTERSRIVDAQIAQIRESDMALAA